MWPGCSFLSRSGRSPSPLSPVTHPLAPTSTPLLSSYQTSLSLSAVDAFRQYLSQLKTLMCPEMEWRETGAGTMYKAISIRADYQTIELCRQWISLYDPVLVPRGGHGHAH